MSISFDNKLSIGNVLTIITLFGGIIVTFSTLGSDVRANTAAMSNQKTKVERIDVIENDIRHIRESLDRIERRIEE